jgi:hypothetical protein
MENAPLPLPSDAPPLPPMPQRMPKNIRVAIAVGIVVILVLSSVLAGLIIQRYGIIPDPGSSDHQYPDNATFSKSFHWTFDHHSYNLQLTITAGEYYAYKDRTVARSPDYGDNAAMAQFVTPSDPIVENLSARLEGMAQNLTLNDQQTLDFMLAFVQGIGYSFDNASTGQEDYWRYSVETLFDHTGDCEDLSILYSSILESTGHDAVLLIFIDASHAAVGAACPGASGDYFPYRGVRYFYCETTSSGWLLGEEPADIQDSPATIVQVP